MVLSISAASFYVILAENLYLEGSSVWN